MGHTDPFGRDFGHDAAQDGGPDSPGAGPGAPAACQVLERDGWTVLRVRMRSPKTPIVVLVAIAFNAAVWVLIGGGHVAVHAGGVIHQLLLAAFVLAGVWAAVWSLVHLFGHTEVRVRGDEGQVWVGIGAGGPWGHTRRFDAGKVRAVGLDERWIETRHGRRLERFITMDIDGRRRGLLGGRTFRLAHNMPEDRRRWLAVKLRRVLGVTNEPAEPNQPS